MKLVTCLEKYEAYHSHYILIPEDFALKLKDKYGKRVLCTVNRDTAFHCAVQRSNTLGYFITVGKTTKKKLKIHHGDRLELKFSKDETKYQAEVPEELKEVLLTDPEGQALFEQLSDGKKRTIIHYINTAKRSETRINRAIRIMENINLGLTDLKEIMR